MDEKDLQKLQDSLRFLESKQRSLKLCDPPEGRAFDSMIRYLKRDIIRVFNLTDYDAEIMEKIMNTDIFIEKVHGIIKLLKS